jgi:hypothetical protein
MPWPALPLARASLAGALLTAGLMTGACSSDRGARGEATAPADYASLRDFTRVEAMGPDNVIVSVGKPFAVRAEGDARALEALRITVAKGALVIDRGRDWKGWWGHGEDGGKGATIHVSMPAISGATLAGSGDMSIDSATAESLTLGLAGAGNMRVGAIAADRLKAEVAGPGGLALAGKAKDADISIAGPGGVDAPGLKLDKGSVAIAGSGSVNFASDGPISVDLVGSGNVTVKGKARCRVNAIGSGETHCGV